MEFEPHATIKIDSQTMIMGLISLCSPEWEGLLVLQGRIRGSLFYYADE